MLVCTKKRNNEQEKVSDYVVPGIFISGISFVMEERAGNPGKIFPGFSVTFLKRVRLISEKGGKRKTDEHRGTLPDIF